MSHAGRDRQSRQPAQIENEEVDEKARKQRLQKTRLPHKMKTPCRSKAQIEREEEADEGTR